MNYYKLVFPGGRNKALSFSYDDAKVSDEELVRLFNTYQVKATFHVPTANFGEDSKNLAVLSSDKIANLYNGHEVSGHGHQHLSMSYLNNEQFIQEVMTNRAVLEELVNYPVKGFAYPMGVHDQRDYSLLEMCGIHYARTIDNSGNFDLPTNPYHLRPTCHHNDERLFELGDLFLNRTHPSVLHSMIVWGHSYEFVFKNNWNRMEQFLEMMTTDDAREKVWYATLSELFDYLSAHRQLQFSANLNFVYNPTDIDIYLQNKIGTITVVPKHEQVIL